MAMQYTRYFKAPAAYKENYQRIFDVLDDRRAELQTEEAALYAELLEVKMESEALQQEVEYYLMQFATGVDPIIAKLSYNGVEE